MTDTTVIAAYAAQYAKACKTEPRVGFDENGLGKPYTYMLIDDITPFMAENDTLFETAKTYGFELRNYEDGSMKLLIVPDHEPGGEYLANRVTYCRELEFKESKKANEANIRNAVYAARTLIQRHLDCHELFDKLHDLYSKPEKSELCKYVHSELGTNRDWIAKAKKRYAEFLDQPDGSNVDNDQVLNGICTLDVLYQNCGIHSPLMDIDPSWFRHYIEKAINLVPGCKDIAYLTNDSCAIAVAIFMEDHFSSEYLSNGLKVPAIYEVLDALAG